MYQAGVGITAFELDLFGRVKNLTEAAYQQYLASEQARRTVHITLVSQVAEAYFRLRATELQRQLIEQTLKSRSNSYDLIKKRFDIGVAGSLDLYQAKSQLDQVRSDLQEIRRMEQQAQNALLLLLGETPGPALPKSAPFSRDQLLAEIPVGLPSDLLVRRPDIIAAENNLLAANANVGAARAAFFPNISLTGFLGFASNAMGGLFGSGNQFWSFTPQLTVPIFGGGVSGNLDLAEARKNIAVSQYEKAIQVAFREVADALAGEATYAEQLDALRELEDSASQSLRIAQLRYENGIDSFLQVQTAEVTLYNAQRLFLDTGLNSLMNRVELYKALGGGWNETTVMQEAQAGIPSQNDRADPNGQNNQESSA
jgi:multidrug efflux system outer membrane protein